MLWNGISKEIGFSKVGDVNALKLVYQKYLLPFEDKSYTFAPENTPNEKKKKKRKRSSINKDKNSEEEEEDDDEEFVATASVKSSGKRRGKSKATSELDEEDSFDEEDLEDDFDELFGKKKRSRNTNKTEELVSNVFLPPPSLASASDKFLKQLYNKNRDSTLSSQHHQPHQLHQPHQPHQPHQQPHQAHILSFSKNKETRQQLSLISPDTVFASLPFSLRHLFFSPLQNCVSPNETDLFNVLIPNRIKKQVKEKIKEKREKISKGEKEKEKEQMGKGEKYLDRSKDIFLQNENVVLLGRKKLLLYLRSGREEFASWALDVLLHQSSSSPFLSLLPPPSLLPDSFNLNFLTSLSLFSSLLDVLLLPPSPSLFFHNSLSSSLLSSSPLLSPTQYKLSTSSPLSPKSNLLPPQQTKEREEGMESEKKSEKEKKEKTKEERQLKEKEEKQLKEMEEKQLKEMAPFLSPSLLPLTYNKYLKVFTILLNLSNTDEATSQFLSSERKVLELCSLILSFFIHSTPSSSFFQDQITHSFHQQNKTKKPDNIFKVESGGEKNGGEEWRAKEDKWSHFVRGLSLLSHKHLTLLLHLTFDLLLNLSPHIRLSDPLLDCKNLLRGISFFLSPPSTSNPSTSTPSTSNPSTSMPSTSLVSKSLQILIQLSKQIETNASSFVITFHKDILFYNTILSLFMTDIHIKSENKGVERMERFQQNKRFELEQNNSFESESNLSGGALELLYNLSNFGEQVGKSIAMTETVPHLLLFLLHHFEKDTSHKKANLCRRAIFTLLNLSSPSPLPSTTFSPPLSPSSSLSNPFSHHFPSSHFPSSFTLSNFDKLKAHHQTLLSLAFSDYPVAKEVFDMLLSLF